VLLTRQQCGLCLAFAFSSACATTTPAASTPAAAPPATGAPSDPQKQTIREGMHSILRQVASCYDNFKQPGDGVFLVTVAADGHAADAVMEGDIGSNEAACIAAAIRTVKFAGPVPPTFRYPFKLR
jgi:hypothetical protein